MMLAAAAVAEPASVGVAPVAAGLNHPWSLAFLPSGDLLVTERNGGLRIVHDGKLESEPISGVPTRFAEIDGGLLGAALRRRSRSVFIALKGVFVDSVAIFPRTPSDASLPPWRR
jgi:glucose/arabinose dehydrogenase